MYTVITQYSLLYCTAPYPITEPDSPMLAKPQNNCEYSRSLLRISKNRKNWCIETLGLLGPAPAVSAIARALLAQRKSHDSNVSPFSKTFHGCCLAHAIRYGVISLYHVEFRCPAETGLFGVTQATDVKLPGATNGHQQ